MSHKNYNTNTYKKQRKNKVITENNKYFSNKNISPPKPPSPNPLDKLMRLTFFV